MRAVIVILIFVALVGAGAFVFLSRNNSQTPVGNQTTSTTSGAVQQNPGDASVAVGSVAAREITFEASEYKFTPSEVRVKKGETVKVTLKNVGKMQHDWKVEGVGGLSIDTTNPGGTTSITITPSQKGTFTTFCSIGAHRQLGMVGKLIVE